MKILSKIGKLKIPEDPSGVGGCMLNPAPAMRPRQKVNKSERICQRGTVQPTNSKLMNSELTPPSRPTQPGHLGLRAWRAKLCFLFTHGVIKFAVQFN